LPPVLPHRTNDNKKYGYYYKSFQKVYISDEEIICKKISGSFGSGYGLYHNYIDHNNFYRMQILPTGRYGIIKYANGKLSIVIDRTDSLIINQGFDIESLEHFLNVASDFRLKTRIKLRTGRNG
jgi:hypothetical protein